MRTYHLREGQIVRVVDGPFTGFCGEVKEVDEKSSIVKVAVQVYGRVTSMDVAPEQIERMAQNSKRGGRFQTRPEKAGRTRNSFKRFRDARDGIRKRQDFKALSR